MDHIILGFAAGPDRAECRMLTTVLGNAEQQSSGQPV